MDLSQGRRHIEFYTNENEAVKYRLYKDMLCNALV